MAATSTIKAIQAALGRAGALWNKHFNWINKTIAYSTHSTEDNPTGTLSRADWDQYLRAAGAIRDGFSAVERGLYDIDDILRRANAKV